MIDAMYRKLINLAYFYDDGKDVAGAFHLSFPEEDSDFYKSEMNSAPFHRIS